MDILQIVHRNISEIDVRSHATYVFIHEAPGIVVFIFQQFHLFFIDLTKQNHTMPLNLLKVSCTLWGILVELIGIIHQPAELQRLRSRICCDLSLNTRSVLLKVTLSLITDTKLTLKSVAFCLILTQLLLKQHVLIIHIPVLHSL